MLAFVAIYLNWVQVVSTFPLISLTKSETKGSVLTVHSARKMSNLCTSKKTYKTLTKEKTPKTFN